MQDSISGHVFEQDGPRLTFRRSWWGYVAGCCLALTFAYMGLMLAANYQRDRNVYVGGGRSFPGRAIDPAHQTPWQKAQYYGILTLFTGPFLLVPGLYVVFGAGEYRERTSIDRQADRVTRGTEVLCKASAVLAIRLVQARGGTGVHARLNGPPWSIELGGFARFGAAERFAGRVSEFLGVGLYDDPIVPRKPGPRGFPVIGRAADKE